MAEPMEVRAPVPQLRTQHPASLGSPALGTSWCDRALQRMMQVFPELVGLSPRSIIKTRLWVFPILKEIIWCDIPTAWHHCSARGWRCPPMLTPSCTSPAPSCRDTSSFCRGGDGDGAVQYVVDHWKCILTFVSGIINLWHIRKSLNETVLREIIAFPSKWIQMYD